jgi:probable F420-dependent oxidoreductase
MNTGNTTPGQEKTTAGLVRDVVFPTQEIPPDPGAVRAFAQAVEALGYARLIAYDHVLGAVQARRDPALASSYDERTPFHEPLTLLAFLAAVTARVELATGVLVLPQRQTALVAKQAAEVDQLSGGRLVLGVGLGWNYVEYESLGVPFTDRGARMEEQVEVLRQLWGQGVVDYSGDYHRLDRVAVAPPVSRAIPIWMGGTSARALKRAARLADGFMFAYPTTGSVGQLHQLTDLLRQNGRNPACVPAELFLSYCTGSDQWAGDVAAWGQAGGARIAIRTSMASARALGHDPRVLESVDDHIAAITEFAEWCDDRAGTASQGRAR